MFVAIFVLLAMSPMATADSYADIFPRLQQLGIVFPVAGMKNILNCTVPTVYNGGTAQAAADKFKTCAINYCMGNLGTTANIMSAISTNDNCMKPDGVKTLDLISNALMPVIVPQITPLYDNAQKQITAAKAQKPAPTQYNAMLPAYTSALNTATRPYVDKICQALLPKMTKLQQKCSMKNLAVLIKLTGYVCADKINAA